MMPALGPVFDSLYLLAGLTGLVAVTVILHRLGYGRAIVAAPALATAALTLAFQASALPLGLRPFLFGLVPAVKPALALVPPAFAVFIAASKRLRPGR
jgi:hypothetical protein